VGEAHGVVGEFGGGLVLDVDVGFRALLFAHGAIFVGHAVVVHHHVVLDHGEPLGFGVLAGAGWGFDSLEIFALGDVGCGSVEAGLFVVPEGEANGDVRSDAGGGEDAGQLHDEGGSGAVVVGGFAPADAVHVGSENVHLVRVFAADLGAVDLFAWAGDGGWGVEFAELEVGLLEGVVVDGVGHEDAALVRAAGAYGGIDCGARAGAGGGFGRGVGVVDALGVGATVALELGFDPVDGGGVAGGALAAVSELG